MHVLNRRSLPSNTDVGAKHGPSTVSFILSESASGEGPRLHRHPYDEIWIVQDGRVHVWIGEDTGEASAGDRAVAPPNTPHTFKNIGQDVARRICIQASPTVIGEWLE